MNGCNHRRACLNQKLVASEVQACLRIHIRPAGKKIVKFFICRGLEGLKFCTRSDFGNSCMIDRSCWPCEIRQDVLIIVLAPAQHRFDQRDFPPFEPISLSSFWHLLNESLELNLFIYARVLGGTMLPSRCFPGFSRPKPTGGWGKASGTKALGSCQVSEDQHHRHDFPDIHIG